MLPTVLNGLEFVERFYSFGSIDSTNNYAKSLKTFPLRGMFVIQADIQTEGRGRNEESFFSDTRGGLWVSLVVPVEEISSHFIYNRSISVAICQSVLELYPQASLFLKWPNDIFWGEKKIAGILLESIPVSQSHLIIGFGLNVNIAQESFPSPLIKIATSLLIEAGMRFSTGNLLKDILIKFHRYCHSEQKTVHEIYSKLLYGSGRRISIEGEDGVFDSVGEDGELIVLTDNGKKTFYTGSIRFR